ncbi:MAG: hypothetical protein HZA61_00600 [Candidatus Eisenbacteria bacterium]|uniref:Arabinogalactan endo-beta-1,4-galactanase n=1 Tax=Eiseniibacteriota bacterium TaxID=2212470 RepID=A0A933S9G5_UNCEI|nr:hypothetical protein [Candidatus Eisenbacteria bacterium]
MFRWQRPLGAARAALRIALLAAALLAAGCGKGSTVAPGLERPYLGMVANPSDAHVNDADSNRVVLETLRSTGVDFIQSGDLWSALESTPGAPSAAVPRFQAKVFSAFGLRQYYNLRLVDTNQRGTPADLDATAWDAPEMFARVDAMVDSLMSVAQLFPFVAFSLGNEVDVYFGAHTGELPAFRALLAREIARVHASRPGLPVGCCITSPVRNPNAWVGDTLNTYTDLRVYTYYPFQSGSDFHHLPPSTAAADLDAMRDHGATPLLLQEVGYSSSAACASSPAAQASFVRHFRQWFAAQSRSRVLGANYFLYTDWSGGTLNTLFGYYGVVTPGFAGYLGGLGLRDSNGVAKEAWEAWRNP